MVAIIIRSILHWISDSFGCKWKLHFQSQIEYYIEVSLFCRGRGPRTKIPQVYISQLQKQDSGYKGAKPIDPWASGTLRPIFFNVPSKSVFPEADSAEVTKAISQKKFKIKVSYGQMTLGNTTYNISVLEIYNACFHIKGFKKSCSGKTIFTLIDTVSPNLSDNAILFFHSMTTDVVIIHWVLLQASHSVKHFTGINSLNHNNNTMR